MQGYRLRVPYGTLLCVSDKPLHGELKLPGQANAFYERAISQHLRIGIETLTEGGQRPADVARGIAGFLSQARTSLDLALYDVRFETDAGALVLMTQLLGGIRPSSRPGRGR